jgi:hypothetical protein
MSQSSSLPSFRGKVRPWKPSTTARMDQSPSGNESGRVGRLAREVRARWTVFMCLESGVDAKGCSSGGRRPSSGAQERAAETGSVSGRRRQRNRGRGDETGQTEVRVRHDLIGSAGQKPEKNRMRKQISELRWDASPMNGLGNSIVFGSQGTI